MSKITALEELCIHLDDANPEIFKSEELEKADEKLYREIINPAIDFNCRKGQNMEELITSVIAETKMVSFIAGYITATNIINDVNKRTKILNSAGVM